MNNDFEYYPDIWINFETKKQARKDAAEILQKLDKDDLSKLAEFSGHGISSKRLPEDNVTLLVGALNFF